MNTITRIGPEGFDIANAFLTYGSISDTAEQLQVPQHEVVRVLQLPEVKRYLEGVYLDQGYRNRNKIGAAFDKIIEAKLEEAEETGVYSSKDLAELLMMQHKMRMDEIKATREAGPGVAVQVNTSNNFGGGEKYNQLMRELFEGDK
jgi:hypothetical protein